MQISQNESLKHPPPPLPQIELLKINPPPPTLISLRSAPQEYPIKHLPPPNCNKTHVTIFNDLLSMEYRYLDKKKLS